MVAVIVRRCKLFVAACLALSAMSGAALAAIPSWTTYRHDSGRSGSDPDSTSPASPTQIWQTPALDGPMWAQPLVYGTRVYVATGNDTVYALDAATGAVVWQKHLATPVPAVQLSCGDIKPNVGIVSTPVIDPGTGRIYVVADTWDGSNSSSIAHVMYALNLSDGSVAVGPVPVDPPGSVHGDQLQRVALALDAGKIIVGYGGNDGDCGTYHGWLVAVPEGGGSLQTFEVDSGAGHSQGAIWGSGNAPPVDSAGDIWISTGNGNSGSTFDFSESVIKLDANLNQLDWWAPTNWQALDSGDIDLGSSMPVLLPGGLVFEIGKGGTGYLLNGSSLGHIGGEIFQAGVCSGSWGGGIYVAGVIYVTCSDGLHALSLNTATRTFSALPGWSVNSNVQGPPTFAGGLIWSTGTGIGATSGNLYALDPRSGATQFSADLGGFKHFVTPSAGGGRLFVANVTQVTAFQISHPPGSTPTSLSLTASQTPVVAGQPVTYTANVSPVPDAGNVAFTDGGQPIAGCGAVTIGGGGASCTTRFLTAGSQTITAAYSGDAFYGASNSSLRQSVTGIILRFRVRVVHHKLRIRLVLADSANVLAVVSKLVPGRSRHHRCHAGARHGRRCTAKRHTRTFHLHGRLGRNSFRPRMRRLAPGRYLVALSAVTPSGARSRRHVAVVTVRRQ
jgi:outer membrane protein assembly factor BamB